MTDFPVITASQRIAVSRIVSDRIGCDFSTGRYAGHDDWIYVAVKDAPFKPVEFHFIGPDGKVVNP